MRLLIIGVALLLASFSVTASEDRPFPWQAITLEFGYGLDEQLDKNRLTGGTLRMVTRDWRVTELTLQWAGGKFAVPQTEFAIVPAPQLETLKVLQGNFYGGVHDNAAYVVVEFRFGKPTFGEHPRAQLLFFSGRYQELNIVTRTSETEWETRVKRPGEESTLRATTNLLLPDTTELAAPPKEPTTERK